MTIPKPDFSPKGPYGHMSEDELLKAFARDFTHQADHAGPITLTLTWLEAWSLMLKALSVSSLQLSFRHPGNTGFVRQHAGATCALLEEMLGTTPVLQEIIRRGRDPQYDEHAGPNTPKGD